MGQGGQDDRVKKDTSRSLAQVTRGQYHWLPGGTRQEILGWVRVPWVVLEDVAREK